MSQSVYRAAPAHQPPRDVYAGVWGIGDRAVAFGGALGITVALLLHGMGVVRAGMSLLEMLEWVRGSRREIATYYFETYEVDLREEEKLEEKKEEKPPEPEPEPEPEPAPKPDAPPPEKVEDPYKEPDKAPPPAAAAAQELLTAKSDDPLDFSEDGFVTGKGPGGIGYVAADGTAKESRNPKAQANGTPGGTGTTPGAPLPPPKACESMPPTIAGSKNWNCPFPPEADAAQVDRATVTVIVTVRPDGSPQSVSVTGDPGNGFGRAARTCALGRRYTAGVDCDGKPTTQATPPLRVTFTR